MAGLIVEIGHKPMGGGDKGPPEGEMSTESEPDTSGGAEASLGEAVDALESKDKETAIAALKAAITSICADLVKE